MCTSPELPQSAWLSPSPLLTLQETGKQVRFCGRCHGQGAPSTLTGAGVSYTFSRPTCPATPLPPSREPGWASRLPERRAVEIRLQDSQATPLGPSLGLLLSYASSHTARKPGHVDRTEASARAELPSWRQSQALPAAQSPQLNSLLGWLVTATDPQALTAWSCVTLSAGPRCSFLLSPRVTSLLPISDLWVTVMPV